MTGARRSRYAAPVSRSSNVRRLLGIARGLRYRTLDGVVGRSARVASGPTAIADVLTALDGRLPPRIDATRQPAPPPKTIAKYGLIDLEFALPPGAAPALPRLSRAEFRALGVLGRDQQSGDGAIDEACLDMFLEEVSEGSLLLKLILDAEGDERSVSERLRHTAKGLPGRYFPRSFRVRDACLTNAPMLWLSKHFYL